MRDRPQDDGAATSSAAAVSGPDADSAIPAVVAGWIGTGSDGRPVAMPSDGQVVLGLGDAGYAKRPCLVFCDETQVIDGLDPDLAAMLAAARDWGGRVHDMRRQKP